MFTETLSCTKTVQNGSREVVLGQEVNHEVWSSTIQSFVDQQQNFDVCPLAHRQPVDRPQNRTDVVLLFCENRAASSEGAAVPDGCLWSSCKNSVTVMNSVVQVHQSFNP